MEVGRGGEGGPGRSPLSAGDRSACLRRPLVFLNFFFWDVGRRKSMAVVERTRERPFLFCFFFVFFFASSKASLVRADTPTPLGDRRLALSSRHSTDVRPEEKNGDHTHTHTPTLTHTHTRTH